MVYIVTYDLRKQERNYDELTKGLQSFGTWWHQTGSVWLIVTVKSSAEIRDYLRQFIDGDDQLFVGQLQKNWAAVGFTKEEYDWLKSLPETSWNN